VQESTLAARLGMWLFEAKDLGGVMPELQPENKPIRQHGDLNGAQQRRLSITCEYIDKLLCDVEQVLHEATSPSPFPRHVTDITPAQARVLEDHIRRLREQLLRTLAWQHMKPNPPDIPATRAALTHLAFIDIAIEELKPSYLRGSGGVAEGAVDELNGVVYELRSIVQGMERYLRQELGTNLEERLKRLGQTGQDVALLRIIEEVVTRHGLVEFRSRISSLAARMEDNNLEVALFGRVSSGKSSLLNALLGTAILPVGVNPITAVPTRLRYGAELRAEITFAGGREEVVALDEFSRLVSEEGNPGNQRNVARALVEVPSPRLKQGIVLVDTPGLGSLARRGAAETMAYLPGCDLALMLVDAAATLNDEDIGTLRLLYEGGIPALVLVSKADLLAQGDLQRVIGYIETQLKSELELSVHVHAVSALPDDSILLDRFFEQELLPRFSHAHSLRESSVARKIGALRESVIAALETSLDRGTRGKSDGVPLDASAMESRLRQVSGKIGEQRTLLDRAIFDLAERPEAVLSAVAEFATARICSGFGNHVAPTAVSEWTQDVVQARVDNILKETREAITNAMEELQDAARQMNRSDKPAPEDVEVLFRDVPRFEMGLLPQGFGAAAWRWLGRWAVGALVRSKLRNEMGSTFKNELHAYGRVLTDWSDQMTRKVQALSNSYTDAYRAQLNRIRGLSSAGEPSPQMENDLALLLRYGGTENAVAMQTQASSKGKVS
jgi:GTP-binding protein EngB required for normal cell division